MSLFFLAHAPWQIKAENEEEMTRYTKPDNINSTLFFDATSKNQIDRDWPALILVIYDNRHNSFRPLFLPLRTVKILSGLLLKLIRGWPQLLIFLPKIQLNIVLF